ncbi:MAG: nucleotidyl transferase AbiEii/AbiGii toxin family protein, partial [Candidatus Thermoplasmatota archaeon]
STRRKGRDLYDVWFLLEQDVSTNKDLFQKKMKVLDSAPVIDIKISKSEWKQDLEVLLERPPEYDAVKKYVTKSLSKKGYKVK